MLLSKLDRTFLGRPFSLPSSISVAFKLCNSLFLVSLLLRSSFPCAATFARTAFACNLVERGEVFSVEIATNPTTEIRNVYWRGDDKICRLSPNASVTSLTGPR